MPYHHILVAVDLTEECDPVIHRARELAVSNSAKLSWCTLSSRWPWPLAVTYRWTCHNCNTADQAKERSDRLIVKYPELSREYSHLTYGQPRQEIHHLAKEQGCDIIVVGSHGRHGLALLLGSTANDVLHGAPCDVLAVRLQNKS